MIRSLILILALVLVAGCNKPGTTSTTPGTLVPTCAAPTDTVLSTFNADRSFPVTTRGVARDGSLAVNLCDGPTFRVVFVEGMKAGDPTQRQGGVFTDGHNHLVHLDDLITTSTTGITPSGLVGVKVTCWGTVNCDPTPAATTPGAVATVAAPPTVTAPAATTPPVTSTASAAPATVPAPAHP